MITWIITTTNEKPERVTSTGVNLTPDGSLVFQDGPTGAPKAIYNSRFWKKVEPSSIQAPVNVIGERTN